MLSPTKKSAVPRLRRRWIFPAGAGGGLALPLLVGALLADELQALRYLFVPFSALACGLTALGAWMHFASLADAAGDTARKWRLRIALAIFAFGSVLLLGLYMGFAVPIRYAGTQRVTYLKGGSRSGRCDCSVDDGTCIQEMMGGGADFHTCWNGVWAVELGLALSYLLTLASAGTVAGLLMVPAGPPQAQGTAPQPPPEYLDFDN